MDLTRRDWLFASGLLASLPEIAAAQEHARHAMSAPVPPAFAYLDSNTAPEIAALTETILPSTDTAGAKEAGVVYFIDRALGTFDRDKQGSYVQGLADLQAKRRELFPGSESIAALTDPQRVELLRTIESSPFFQTLRFHTLAGFLGDPSYGGNRDSTGWNVIGFDHEMIHQPPFGYYDAREREGSR